jgi:hypothetical protein
MIPIGSHLSPLLLHHPHSFRSTLRNHQVCDPYHLRGAHHPPVLIKSKGSLCQVSKNGPWRWKKKPGANSTCPSPSHPLDLNHSDSTCTNEVPSPLQCFRPLPLLSPPPNLPTRSKRSCRASSPFPSLTGLDPLDDKMKDRILRQVSPRASRLNYKLLESHMRTLPRSPSRSKKGVWESHLYKSLDRQMATLPDLSAKQHFRLVGHLWKRRKRVDSQRCLRFSNPTVPASRRDK